MKRVLVPCMLILGLVNIFFVSIIAFRLFIAAPLLLSCRPAASSTGRAVAFFTDDMSTRSQAVRPTSPAVITRTYPFTGPDVERMQEALSNPQHALELCTVRKNISRSFPQNTVVIIIYPENLEQ